MTSPTDAPFAFDFVDFSFVDKGEFTGRPELRLLGLITKGSLTRQLPIIFPTDIGTAKGVVGQFMDTLEDWLGLPFYDLITVDTLSIDFCLCIIDFPPNVLPICPGTAYLDSYQADSPFLPDFKN